MIKNANVAPILTGVIIVIGLAFIMPAYYQSYYEQRFTFQQPPQSFSGPSTTSPKIMLAFDINNNNNNLPDWCNNLLSLIKKYDLKGSIFISGMVAEKYPQCVTMFSPDTSNFDIGSQTYSYANLTSILDYSKQLAEVLKGKKAIDDIGKINSSLFKAPYGSTDQNIYSLLSRSGILADFSYTSQYNKYENGQFIKYDLVVYNGSKNSTSILNDLSSKNIKVALINFDSSVPINEIDNFISKVRTEDKKIEFINASELTGMNLNVR